MARICAIENVTLDGVLQGPARTDEDTRNGFPHSGWAVGYQDHVAIEFMGAGLSPDGGENAMLFGRRSYDDILGHWTSVGEPNPFTDHLTNARKFVASRSVDTRLVFPNSTLLPGEAVESVTELKRQRGGDISIIGSGELVRALHGAGLIDAYVLSIHPITLGVGARFFPAGIRRDLHLERTVTTTTGVIIAEYSVATG